ncbi:MAG TPA: peptidase T [Eubacterium sp.]|nr:peptidase T [Eubacterium sp.]HAZ87469.1 peptidase T [Eubacterium sp.]
MVRAYERLLKYVSYETTSDENSQTCPSSAKELVLADELVEELKAIGVADAHVDKDGYVYGSIPATKGAENEKTIGLIAHMDTAPAMSGADIKPRIINDYDGADIVLNEKLGVVMDTVTFPQLRNYVGQDLIVTDGTTLLGADDKAGIAEIMTAAAQIIEADKACEGNTDEHIAHGKICIAFTPDEEIGRGADRFNVESFGADYAYTVDGGMLGEIEFENFNAASAKVHIKGENIHPGEAKNKMKNASLLAMEFNSMLPPAEIPAHTEGYEGFFHLCGMSGDEENAYLDYIVRDHNMDKFLERKAMLEHITAYLNTKYGAGTVNLDMKDSYYNMREKLEADMYIVDRAVEAMRENGVEPIIQPIRGGTDGARLSFMGLLCPNLSTGGHNFHGKYEYICIQSMDKMVEIIKSIVCKVN